MPHRTIPTKPDPSIRLSTIGWFESTRDDLSHIASQIAALCGKRLYARRDGDCAGHCRRTRYQHDVYLVRPDRTEKLQRHPKPPGVRAGGDTCLRDRKRTPAVSSDQRLGWRRSSAWNGSLWCNNGHRFRLLRWGQWRRDWWIATRGYAWIPAHRLIGVCLGRLGQQDSLRSLKSNHTVLHDEFHEQSQHADERTHRTSERPDCLCVCNGNRPWRQSTKLRRVGKQFGYKPDHGCSSPLFPG